MKLKKLLILGILITGFYSCEAELEEEIFSTYSAENFYNNEEQLQAQNLGIYEAFRHVVWEQDMYFLVSMTSRYATSRVPSFAWHAAYQTADRQPFRYERLWNVGYNAISRANTIIKYVPLSSFFEKNPEIAKQYIAEARWMRAYSYFQLTQLFGDLPLYTEPVESADPEVLFKARSSVQDVYNVIIEDLEFASENLPVSWNKTGTGRVTKAGGAFLLGKVYLTSAGYPLNITANYQKAINALKPLADNSGAYNVELLSDWKSVFSIANEGNKEVIFAHGNIYENLLGSVLPFWTNPQFSEFGGIQSRNGSGYQIAWHPDLLNLYEAGDTRLADGFTYSYTRINNNQTITYSRNPINARGARYEGRNGISMTKYQDGGAIGNVIHSKDHIVYRYVDAFLMLAEAYNENNEPAKALPYLKIARDRVNASTITTTNQNALRTIIREERIRELYGEMGELFDARRWDITEEEFNNHRLRQWRNPNLQWTDRNKLSPIPFVELAKNPNLTQNPDW
ncbi:RagB/SusD family nutrient uptake outer membrane protein [Polaribacter aestuariivivens]|uniref:RagB/SusD family nutrient uptake outer membrane protein n=1 Tax=Polaribacter aestuariivivens TaxID=2304626 RepID=A0A5S3N5Q1_9FLAO|nr:RagB/SusD family nutrient uptake outer membrane protein [Polaribacter aestuariivivens]TMM30623.1 RagB/SusD family nutrient uptake outer membrane protein [Polaribacter aestuariivivens]